MSAKTVKNVHGVLHNALKQAVLLGYIRSNPSDACTLPRIVKKEMKPMQEDDISKFLEAIKGHKFECLFLVDLFTGMRQSEILGLTWDCVDFKKGTVLVNKQLQREKKKGGKYRFVPNKNDKIRRITPAPYIMEVLSELQQKQKELFSGLEKPWKETELVFTNESGDHLETVKNFV